MTKKISINNIHFDEGMLSVYPITKRFFFSAPLDGLNGYSNRKLFVIVLSSW